MYKQLTLYKIAFLNVLLAVLLLVWTEPLPYIITKITICLMNSVFLAIVLHNLPRFLKRNDGRLLIGRKRTLIVLMSSVYIFIILFSIYYELTPRDLFIVYAAWTVFIAILYLFADPISAILHRIFKKKRRIAVVGYDDSAHRLTEKLKRKANNYFISHLDHENIITNSTADFATLQILF